MKRKKTLSVIAMLCTVMILCAIPCQALLNWNTVETFRPTFYISGSTAYWGLTVVTSDANSSIRASVYLYQERSNGGEVLIDSWTLLDGTGRLDVSGSHSNLSSGSYRLAIYVQVDGASGEDLISEERYDTKS